MDIRPYLSNAGLLTGHVLLAFGGAAWLALSPPTHGAMLLVPIGNMSESEMFGLTLAAGALPVARGPLPGSLVLSGDRAEVARAADGYPTLLIAAPYGGCGTISPEPV